MNKEEFIKELKQLHIDFDESMIEKLEQYKNLLQRENKLYNLTTIISDEQIYLKHFYDSLTIVKQIDLNNMNNILDVGTGAGFPGIVLKIFFPNLKVYLLDSNNKKIHFLNLVIKELNLKDIYVFKERCEVFAHSYLNYFDLVTSRAVSSLDNLLEMCLPMVKINGYFIPLKGEIDKELEENKKTVEILGSKLESVIKFSLPIEKSNRVIPKFKRIKLISDKYPRTYDKIKKYPLKKSKI